MKQIANILLSISLFLSVSVSATVYAAPNIPKFIYQKLNAVNALMDTESWQEASDLLKKMASQTDHKYVQALIAQSQGQIAIHQDNMLEALERFQVALNLNVLDESVQNQLLHSISQLHCSVEEWIHCREKMQQWMSLEPTKVKANDYIILAQAYAATETWKEVVAPTNSALKLKDKAPKSWYQMLVVAHTNLEQWSEAVDAQHTLLEHYSAVSDEWRRLVALHLSQDDSLSALNSMRLPYEKGLLTRAQDVRQMSLLLYHAELPYQAADTLSKGMTKGWIEANERNLKLLANLWAEAKSYEKAVETYEELTIISPKRKWYKQLASLHFQMKNWDTVVKVIKDVTESSELQLGNKEKSNLELMLGMALVNMDKLDEAKGILEPLTNRDSVKSQAKNWLDYIDQVQNV